MRSWSVGEGRGRERTSDKERGRGEEDEGERESECSINFVFHSRCLMGMGLCCLTGYGVRTRGTTSALPAMALGMSPQTLSLSTLVVGPSL